MGALALFLRLVRASVGGQARYPASALLLTVGQFLGTGIEMVAVWALFHRFGSVQGWHIGEVALFYGLVNCMFAIADALGRGFDVLGTEFLRTGAFDRLLLRPRPLALQLMGHDFRISRLGRLLQGDRATLRLLAGNPFPDGPPRFVRARVFLYRFSTPAERRAGHVWWVRTDAGVLVPPVTLPPDTPHG